VSGAFLCLLFGVRCYPMFPKKPEELDEESRAAEDALRAAQNGLCFPQCGSLRSGLNTRSGCRWIACCAKIIGPLCSAARDETGRGLDLLHLVF
jgi:hypothetical protein